MNRIVYVQFSMSSRLVLSWDAKPTRTSFLPTVTIRNGLGAVIFEWVGSCGFESLSSALLFARDYGEVALGAVRKRRLDAH